MYSEADIGLVYWAVGFIVGRGFFPASVAMECVHEAIPFLWGTAHVQEKWIAWWAMGSWLCFVFLICKKRPLAQCQCWLRVLGSVSLYAHT